MKYLLYSALLLNLFSCTVDEPKVSTTLFDVKASYMPYQRVLEKNSRSAGVFSNYEKLYTLGVTRFSSDFYETFKSAVGERFRSLEMIEGIQRNTSFYVSIFAPNDEYSDLSNSHLWEFILKIDAKEFKPKMIRKIRDKDAWSPFFSYTNRWSTDFLIVFDVPESEKMDNSKCSLYLSTTRAKTQMNW